MYNCIRSDVRVEMLETRKLFTVGSLNVISQDLGGNLTADAADPVRNTAYVYDQSTQHILAISTAVGNTTAVATPAANVASLAVSIDDTRLFASEPGAFQIEEFNLPSMTLLRTLSVGVAVQQIVAAANNRIIGDTGQITGFNADTGATLYNMAGDYDGLLHTNADGTALYSRARGLSGNDGSIRVWDISGTGNPVSETAIPGPTGANSTDFDVNTHNNEAYFGDGGASGIEVTLLSTGNQTLWSFQDGNAVQGLASLPVGYVYATTFNGYITQFNISGQELASAQPANGPTAQTLVITPNGNLLCLYSTGIEAVGVPSLNVTQTPTLLASTTTISATPTSTYSNYPVQVLITVATTTSGGPTPTGTLTFTVPTLAPETDNLYNGVVSTTVTFIPGTYILTAQYNGDGTYAASAATPVTITVAPAVVALAGTVTQLSSATPNPAAGGTPVVFTGTVASSGESNMPPTGTVALSAGTRSLGTAALQTDGSFTLTTSDLPVGVDPITATYSGDSTYATSTSAAFTVTVTGTLVLASNSLTSLSSVTPDPSLFGSMIVFRGSVASALGSAPVPTGLVTLFDGDTSIGNAALLGDGSFTFTYASLPIGTDALTARYLGDSVYTASASAAVAEVVMSSIVPSFGAASVPASVVAGAVFTGKLPLTVTDDATDTRGKFEFNVYVDTSPTLDGTQTLVQSTSKSFALKAGKSKPIALKLKSLPATLADGTYYVLAQVIDPNGDASVARLDSTVRVAAPFVALSATVGPLTPAVLVAGKPASVIVTVTNAGNTPAKGRLTVVVGPSTNSITFGTAVHVGTIQPGKFTKVRVHFKYDGTLPTGTYTLQAVASFGDIIMTALGSTFTA